jgi:hypothetical protein
LKRQTQAALSDRSSVECPRELRDYPLSEQRAILVHRYFLGIEWKREPSLADTLASWEARFAQEWRRKKAMLDVAAQLKEIERHKYLMSERNARDVGWEEAAKDWIITHAGAWRDWWERQPHSGP